MTIYLRYCEVCGKYIDLFKKMRYIFKMIKSAEQQNNLHISLSNWVEKR